MTLGRAGVSKDLILIPSVTSRDLSSRRVPFVFRQWSRLSLPLTITKGPLTFLFLLNLNITYAVTYHYVVASSRGRWGWYSHHLACEHSSVAFVDLIVTFQTRDLIQPLVVTPGKDFNTKFGNFRQADFVGVPYGSKIPSRTGRGFLLILRPTPELWTLALPHRTQILYLADIAFITSSLNIKKGSRVIEAGVFTVTEIRDLGIWLFIILFHRYVHHQMTPLHVTSLISTQRYRICIILPFSCKNHRLIGSPMVVRIPWGEVWKSKVSNLLFFQ